MLRAQLLKEFWDIKWIGGAGKWNSLYWKKIWEVSKNMKIQAFSIKHIKIFRTQFWAKQNHLESIWSWKRRGSTDSPLFLNNRVAHNLSEEKMKITQ